MLRMIWSQVRDMHVEVFQNKIVYNIPIYSESIFKFFTYNLEQTSGGLRLTITKSSESLLK
jgi:hypothetical protein